MKISIMQGFDIFDTRWIHLVGLTLKKFLHNPILKSHDKKLLLTELTNKFKAIATGVEYSNV